QDFEPAAAGPGAAAPALLAPAPKLPPYLRTASPEDEAHLARVYEAAMRSATGRAVLARVADLAGQGRQPVLIEVFDYRPSENFIGYLSLEWELVRLERSLVRGRPEEGAPTLIHELTHVLQAAGGILMGSLESELEANLHTLQVGRELGVTFKRGSMYESLARAFRQSPAAFIEAVDHNYPDYFRLLGGNLNKAEDQLLKEHATAERAVAEQEALLSGLRADYEVLRAEGHPEAALKEFHETQIQPARVQLGRYDAYLGAVRRDLRLLYTLPGRTRYVEFTRDLVKKMRSFRRRYRAQGAAGRTAPPLRLPSLEQAQTFQPRPLRPAAPRRKAGKAGAEAAPAPARPDGILILPAENADWAARALARLGESALGRRLLADVGRAARRRGRPFVLEVLRGTRHFELDYDWGTELILVSERNVKSSLDDAAPYLAKGLTEALRAEESAYHGLELPLEAWAAALETARELGVQPRAGTPLRSAQLRFAKPDLAEFTAWVRSFYLGVFMLSDRTSAEFAASLEPFRRRMERDRRRSEDYLRQRVATEALMASAAHPRAARNLYQDAEDLLVRLDIADAARELAWIERDRAALSDSREETLRRHASEAMERVRAYHAAAQAGGAQ
ncbi:MAG TPA: hypothetical protein VNI01_09800, partial [Elusimicrobiota bacterium]|nr:hypothetical protein [Elusimicrobiota bacterium]